MPKPTVTIVPDETTLLRLSAEADVRKNAFLTGFRAKFGIGAQVVWLAQDVRQTGEVTAWSDDLKTLEVRNDDTGAQYWISPRAVVAGLLGAA